MNIEVFFVLCIENVQYIDQVKLSHDLSATNDVKASS